MLIISILISKDVFDQYSSKAASFKHYEEVLTEKESVTVVLGLWPHKDMDNPTSTPYQSYEQWKLGKDFFLSYGVMDYNTPQEMIYLKENNDNLKISHSDIGNVKFHRLITKWGSFYKISANVINVKAPFWVFVQISFDKSVADENIPGNEVHFSSEYSSFGKTMSDWRDGQQRKLDKAQGFNWVKLVPKKVIKMDSNPDCADPGFYSCFHSELIRQNFDHCPKRCFSISTYLNATPLCQTLEEFQCAHEITKQVHENTNCLSACTRLDYEIENMYQEDRNQTMRNVIIAYRVSNSKMKVEEEYLIQDFVGMLGSLGGSLGLFIGFSFLGGLSYILDYLQLFFERYSYKTFQSENISEEVIQVKPKRRVMPNDYYDETKSHAFITKILKENKESTDELLLTKIDKIQTEVDSIQSINQQRFHNVEKELSKISKVLGIVERKKKV